ncbi:MAG: glutathione S-transferase [Cypionkella sp.]|uniref:glutathione S-transferase family protein n=1 Tax=Cypionkella sp. TaxID=2811411 RepID=UPI002622B1BB|nr:glutathione S-transferase family protein [Cypionkella sp.]MDB5660786.1 glutathione S-transferase [Cypionkella sp.]
MLIFYTNPQSRARISHWMLEEVGQPYETRVLEYGTTMKAPEYLAINPMGKVPALVHDGQVITEGAAIVTYLADAFPEAGLMPTNRAAFYRWMFFGAGPVDAAVTNKALGVEVPPERRGMVGYGSLSAVCDVLANQLEKATYICGDSFSAADVYVGSLIGFGMSFNTIEPRPVFSDYWARLKQRPAYIGANALCDALLAKEN